MGRFGSLFRKSDEKEKAEPPSNPYAQQQSTDAYAQSNSYAAAQNRQVPSGLPSGPRTGLPSGPRPGSSAPPPYTQSPSLYSKDSPTFPTDSKRQDIRKLSDSGYQTGSPTYSNYQQSPNLPSGGSSPAVGYGNDRFGAQGGYGSNRYDNTAAYGQNNYNAAPSQKIPGGYGGLGGDDNELFSGYNPRPQHQEAAFIRPDNYNDLTEAEKGEVDADEKKAEIINTIRDTAASSARSRQMMTEGKQRLLAMNEALYRDGEILTKVEQQIEESHHQSRIATANLKNLDAANSSLWNFAANTKGKRAEHEKMKIASDYQRHLAKQEGRDYERETNAQWQTTMQQKPQPTLGLPKTTDHSRYTFEDDDGEQEELNQQIEENVGVMMSEIKDFKRLAEYAGAQLDQQNAQTSRIGSKTDQAQDSLQKNRDHLRIKYHTNEK